MIDERTQYFWQPLSEHFSLQESVSAQTSQTDVFTPTNIKLSTTDTNTSSATTTMGFGLNDHWAMFLLIPQYSKTAQNVTQVGSGQFKMESDGLSDPSFAFANTTDFKNWKLYYGIAFSVSINPLKKSTQTNPGNKSVGGLSVNPYLGASFYFNIKNRVGIKASYLYYSERIENDQTIASTVIDGGNQSTVALFYEYQSFRFFILPVASITWTELENQFLNGVATHADKNVTNAASLSLGYYFNQKILLSLVGSIISIPATINSTGNNVSAMAQKRFTCLLRYEF